MTMPYEHYEDDPMEMPEVPVVKVHVVNASEMHAPEKPASMNHVVTRTVTDIGSIIEVLQLDPNRIKTEYFVSGVGTVFLCHSENQAQAALTGVGGNFGAAITCPGAGVGSIHWTDSTKAKLWAVMTGASPVLSMISERK